jgi:hypothetical protein
MSVLLSALGMQNPGKPTIVIKLYKEKRKKDRNKKKKQKKTKKLTPSLQLHAGRMLRKPSRTILQARGFYSFTPISLPN